jgi:hypothetical protein
VRDGSRSRVNGKSRIFIKTISAMRRIYLGMAIVLSFGGTELRAQSDPATGAGMAVAIQTPRSYGSQVSYQKTQQPATLIDLPYPPDVVERSIRDYMGRYGWKGSGSHGFTAFKNVRLDDRASEVNDVFFRVDRKNRDKTASTVAMLVARPGEDPAMRATRDTGSMSRAGIFLERMVPAITSGDLEARIKDQEGATKKSQHKLGNLRGDQLDLEKRIRNTQSDLDHNRSDQAMQSRILEESVKGTDADATKKSRKKMDKLLDDENSLEKKLQKYQSQLVQNKRDQDLQQVSALQQQQMLDSLRRTRVQ